MSLYDRVSLAQLIRFLMIKLIHSGLNPRFDISVIFTTNYSFSWRNVLVNSDAFLLTYFVTLKIKSTQFFGGAHRGRVYVHVFLEVSARTLSVFVLYFFKKYPCNTFYQVLFSCSL
jgi:hypothetical protein